jgi:hypothetical protein
MPTFELSCNVARLCCVAAHSYDMVAHVCCIATCSCGVSSWDLLGCDFTRVSEKIIYKVHIFCVTDSQLWYEQLIYNCTAVPPYLHITSVIAAACTTFSVPCWYQSVPCFIATSRSVAANIVLQHWRHDNRLVTILHIPSQSVWVP